MSTLYHIKTPFAIQKSTILAVVEFKKTRVRRYSHLENEKQKKRFPIFLPCDKIKISLSRTKENFMGQLIPIFFACNDKYVPYLDVAITSLQAHISQQNDHHIIILKTDITEENQNKLKTHESNNLTIEFFDVNDILKPIKQVLPDMFYYTLAAYYRLFIEKAFPQYDKAIYLDSDVVLLSDIAELYNIDIGDNLIGAVYEQNTDRDRRFTNYVEDIIGIPHNTYFNSGVMVMNLKEFRRFGVQDRFLNMLTTYNFDCLAPTRNT